MTAAGNRGDAAQLITQHEYDRFDGECFCGDDLSAYLSCGDGDPSRTEMWAAHVVDELGDLIPTGQAQTQWRIAHENGWSHPHPNEQAARNHLQSLHAYHGYHLESCTVHTTDWEVTT